MTERYRKRTATASASPSRRIGANGSASLHDSVDLPLEPGMCFHVAHGAPRIRRVHGRDQRVDLHRRNRARVLGPDEPADPLRSRLTGLRAGREPPSVSHPVPQPRNFSRPKRALMSFMIDPVS